MGFEKGRGLGKNLQGRALPIQVVKREGKGAVGRYGNEDPNRARPTEGTHWIIFFALRQSIFLSFRTRCIQSTFEKRCCSKCTTMAKTSTRSTFIERSFAFIYSFFLFLSLENTKTTICI